jgi:hypothetical protein
MTAPIDGADQVVRATAGLFADNKRPLARAVADSELERLSQTLRALAAGSELFYDGEDRELLLALARECSSSILATAWATASGHGVGFESGFWLNDLGGRYLALQRDAVRRGVTIKRLFIYDTPELIGSAASDEILALHRDAGVEVRTMSGGLVSPDGAVADFIVFDEQISYETVPVGQADGGPGPWLLTTRLVMDEGTVRDRLNRYNELWEQAVEP